MSRGIEQHLKMKIENFKVIEMNIPEQRDCNAGAAVVNYRGGNTVIYACYAVHNAFIYAYNWITGEETTVRNVD